MILSFFQVDNRCVLLQPFLHAVHVVFGCDNRRSVVDFGEARSFIPVSYTHLSLVPVELRTEAVCLRAVSGDGILLHEVPEELRTERVCEAIQP